MENVVREGFKAKLKINERPCQRCLKTGGFCSFDRSATQFCCKEEFSFYPNRIKEFYGALLGIRCIKTSHSDDVEFSSMEGSNPASFKFVITGNRALLLSICMGCVIVSMLIYFLNKIKALKHPRLESFEELVPLKRYSYVEVKEITKSFAQEIGRGGFIIVYGGNLSDSLKVAVKVLKESKKNGEDFINEMASMSRTSRLHIQREQLYMNLWRMGHLISSYQVIETSLRIDLRKLYEIALRVARGLQYLHYACKTRIVHFDIKPHNILLGKDLCPKISDFGLAKLCGIKQSILLMPETRETIGYIAPEVFSRIYERVSHKSDVYSYGMMVLEMIGQERSTSQQLYFPDWIYKDLEERDCKRLLDDEIT